MIRHLDRGLVVLPPAVRRELQAARFERGKAAPTEDTWPWPAAGPDVATEVAAAVATLREEEGAPDAEVLLSVAERLQTELHLPAVKEAKGSVAVLHP